MAKQKPRHFKRAHVEPALIAGLTALALAVTPRQQDQLLLFTELLTKWNRVYNLTAEREPLAIMTRHILDSLSIAPHLPGQRIIDVGTGPGLPGMPLAILFPDRHFTLLDSNSKRMRFLAQAIAELKMDNVELIEDRVENFQPSQCYDSIITRAFSRLLDIVIKTRHLCCQGGTILAMKGNHPEEEVALLTNEVAKVTTIRLAPAPTAERHLILLNPFPQ